MSGVITVGDILIDTMFEFREDTDGPPEWFTAECVECEKNCTGLQTTVELWTYKHLSGHLQ